MKTVNAPLQVIDIALQKPLIQWGIASFLQKLRIPLLRYFSSGEEPQIWQEVCQSGNFIWHIYDPKSDRSFTFKSESEVRIWIEKRYSQ